MLASGTVLYLEVHFPKGPRNKYLIVIDVDTEVHTLIINSEVHDFFGYGEFGDCYVPIDVKSHDFLERDSHIDCNEVKRLNLADVVAELRNNPNCLKGAISDGVTADIIAAIRRTPGLAPTDKDRYCRCLSPPAQGL